MLADFVANTRQSPGGKAGGDIDFLVFYILPVPSSLSAKWRRKKSGRIRLFLRRVAYRRNATRNSRADILLLNLAVQFGWF